MADDIWGFLGALAAAHDALARAEQEERRRRYNSPEARAARSARSKKAAATRKARKDAQRAVEDEREARMPSGPTCDAMDVILDARETVCILPPHDGGDHEDIDGHTWPFEED